MRMHTAVDAVRLQDAAKPGTSDTEWWDSGKARLHGELNTVYSKP